MRTARLHAVRDLRVHTEVDAARPGDGWSLVRITSVGLCGSDLHWFVDGGIGENRITRPVVPGHEMAGIVVEGPLVGRRVAVDPAIPCGRCEFCRAGHGNLCPTVQFAGHGELDGGMQELLIWPDHLLFELPDAMSDDGGALLEPLGVAIHAVRFAHVRPGDDVLVVGAGPIGVLAMHVLRTAGARRVFASEPLAHRRTAARAAGADAVWDAPLAVQGVLDETAGRGVDVVVEVAGTDHAIDTAVAAARPGARVVLTGIPGEDRSSFPASSARRKGLTFTMVRRMHDTYPAAIGLATSEILLDEVVSDRYPLSEAAHAFSTAAQRTGQKVIVDLTR